MGLLFVGGLESNFAKIKYTKALKDLDNKIIECSVNSQGEWEFMRERTDKMLPNSYNTAVCKKISAEVVQEFILFKKKYSFFLQLFVKVFDILLRRLICSILLLTMALKMIVI